MALLLNLEVLGIPEMLDMSHARAIARASTVLSKAFQSLKFPRFQDSLNK